TRSLCDWSADVCSSELGLRTKDGPRTKNQEPRTKDQNRRRRVARRLRPRFDLLVAVLALGADRRAVLRGVAAVVTAEAPGRRDVAEVVGIGAERHLHDRKDVAPVDVLQRRHGAGDGRVAAAAG